MSRQVLSYGEIADDPADSFVYEPPSVSQNKKKRKRKDARSYQHRDRQLTQSEVWDDSALIAAWDDAVQDFEVKSSSIGYHADYCRGTIIQTLNL